MPIYKEEKMKKTYETPKVQIVTFDTEDVLAPSGGINTPFYPINS